MDYDSESHSDESHVSATPPGSPVHLSDSFSRFPFSGKASSPDLALGARANLETKHEKPCTISSTSRRKPALGLKTKFESEAGRGPSMHSPTPSTQPVSRFHSLPFRIISAPAVKTLSLEIIPAGYFSRGDSSKLRKRDAPLSFEAIEMTEDCETDRALKKPKVLIPNLLGPSEPSVTVAAKKSVRDVGNFVKMNLNGKGRKKFKNLNRRNGSSSTAKRKFRRNA